MRQTSFPQQIFKFEKHSERKFPRLTIVKNSNQEPFGSKDGKTLGSIWSHVEEIGHQF